MVIMRSKKYTKKIILASAIVLLAVGLAACNGDLSDGQVPVSGPVGSQIQGTVGGTPAQNAEYQDIDEAAPFAEATLVWYVEPTLEHEIIRLCVCGVFLNQDDQQIDPATGFLTGYPHFGHGGGLPPWVYDQERGLFGHPGYSFGYHTLIGMHPLDEFEESVMNDSALDLEFLLMTSDGFIVVQSVDSSLRYEFTQEIWHEFDNEQWHGFSLNEEAFHGKFALMHDRVFVTDFVYDEIALLHTGWPLSIESTLFAVRIGDRRGLLEVGKEPIMLPFDNLILISETTAFARYNGQYGILDIPRTLRTIELP